MKKLVSILLSLALALSMISVDVFASAETETTQEYTTDGQSNDMHMRIYIPTSVDLISVVMPSTIDFQIATKLQTVDQKEIYKFLTSISGEGEFLNNSSKTVDLDIISVDDPLIDKTVSLLSVVDMAVGKSYVDGDSLLSNPANLLSSSVSAAHPISLGSLMSGGSETYKVFVQDNPDNEDSLLDGTYTVTTTVKVTLVQ